MSNVMFLIVVSIIYLGAAAIGIGIFGEGEKAAYFGAVVGTVGFICFYKLILGKGQDGE
jgi:hypothetical protein